MPRHTDLVRSDRRAVQRSRVMPVLAACVAVIAVYTQSLAWACTGGGGSSTTLQPSSGQPDTGTNAVATGLATTIAYELLFADAAKLSGNPNCGVQGTIGGPTVSDSQGTVASTLGIIPFAAASGIAQVWFAAQGNPTNRSPSATFTVVGGDDCMPLTNRMRFQVQWNTSGNGPTFSTVATAPMTPGVTVIQANLALDDVLAQVQPAAARTAATAAVNQQKAWVAARPPAGVSGQVNHPVYFNYGGYSDARVDVENIRGDNLNL